MYKLYSTRLDSPESRALDLPDAQLLSSSPAGELAICLGQTSHVVPGNYDCTLARVALAGERRGRCWSTCAGRTSRRMGRRSR